MPPALRIVYFKLPVISTKMAVCCSHGLLFSSTAVRHLQNCLQYPWAVYILSVQTVFRTHQALLFTYMYKHNPPYPKLFDVFTKMISVHRQAIYSSRNYLLSFKLWAPVNVLLSTKRICCLPLSSLLGTQKMQLCLHCLTSASNCLISEPNSPTRVFLKLLFCLHQNFQELLVTN